jgi:hypothetical protein
MCRQAALGSKGSTNMAIVDHFKSVEDPGFIRAVDPKAARRQFNMSLGLVVVLAVAAAGIALSFRFQPQVLEAQMRAPAKLVVQMPQPAKVMQAAEHARQLPGG